MINVRTEAALGACLLLLIVMAGTLRATEVPFLTGRVNDEAGILSPETTGHLNALLRAHEDSTSNQVVVLTVPSLEGEGVESFSMRVADSWKIGQKGRDNGVLLLVSRDDRNVRIEVGQGLEGSLPDITCGMIIRHEIIPRFKQGDYDAGVTAGVLAILDAIGGSYVASDSEQLGTDDLFGRLMGGGIFLVVVGLFTVIGVVTKGCPSWFLYAFLLPFWGLFPTALLGFIPGVTVFALYAVGFPLLKFWFARSTGGKRLLDRLSSTPFLAAAAAGGTSSGSGSWSSSSGGGFSGGGGGFSGGGASGSW